MGADETSSRPAVDTGFEVKLKLAALWTAVMFFYIYVDIFSFYKPGTIESIQSGRIWEFEITQLFILASLLLMSIPILMVFLSVVLPARANRWLNIVVALLFIVVSLGNTLGESWVYFYFGAALEVVLLGLVVWYAWNWSRTPEAGSA